MSGTGEHECSGNLNMAVDTKEKNASDKLVRPGLEEQMNVLHKCNALRR